ncbi:MAG: chromate efflux transporter [Sphingomonadales bacterium]|nr:chromate efflux transporter [Sphingomonadales bacterium]
MTPSIPTFAEALKVWLKIGLLSFGGPAGQIALMHRTLVDEKRWIGEGRFLHALNFCMLLPGPEAQQLATYMGWLMHGWRGGIAAGALFVLPGAAVVLALAALYAYFGALPLAMAVFVGVKAAVLAIVIEALLRIARRALKAPFLWALAGASFVAIFALNVRFPVIVVGAALFGLAATRFGWLKVVAEAEDGALIRPRTAAQTAGILIGGLALWFLPVAVCAVAAPPVFTDISLFFSKLAVVTFGGAYAVLAYMAQAAVEGYQWLSAGEMLDGLGLAETTPGPLILVTEFVGFLAAFRDPGGLSPLFAGTLGALLTLWVTFVPSFLWIFLGAPYVERLYGNRALKAALAAITAAVVGVILNLAAWFALHVLFADLREWTWGPLRLLLPDMTTLQPLAAALALVAAYLLLRRGWGMAATLALAAAVGGAAYFI